MDYNKNLEQERNRLIEEIDLASWVNDRVGNTDNLMLAKLLVEDLIAHLNNQLYRINIKLTRQRKNKIFKTKAN